MNTAQQKINMRTMYSTVDFFHIPSEKYRSNKANKESIFQTAVDTSFKAID